jgi:hypothetical protein
MHAFALGFDPVGGILAGLLIVAYFGVIIFLISLLWRITLALEEMARHQLEIARDVKKLAQAAEDEEE